MSMTRAAFLVCIVSGAACLILSNVLGIIGGMLILLAFYVRIGEIETEQHMRGFSVAMEKFPGMVLEALSSRAMAHNHAPNMAHATECLLIANEVIKPLWMDASREASGLNVAALEKRA